jgi:CubicO group peptidase (beta-lactamase class C family)
MMKRSVPTSGHATRVVRTLSFLLLLCPLAASAVSASERQAVYYPGPWDDWQTKQPEEVGMDSALLREAADYAIAHETKQPTDPSIVLPMAIGDEPFDEIVGPVKERGGLNGIVLRHGYIVAEWGDTRRVDMTFSVTKSYLSTVAGLAFDKGLIRDVHDPVRYYVQDGGFDSPHNAKITWHMLLNQTSEWEGTLWGKPDWADRWGGKMRELHEPGTHWQYNDVRVNRLALALLQVWRRPLPQVLKEHIMDPIDASPTWRWHGYENSWVTIDGAKMQSVSGGGHWGGGMWISTRDHARFGYLFLRRGTWRDRQLLSEKWIDMATTPTDIKPTYGYMNWEPNTERKLYPSAPENNFFAHGAGTNMIWVDPEHDLVSVVRWIEGDIDGYIKRVLAAIK